VDLFRNNGEFPLMHEELEDAAATVYQFTKEFEDEAVRLALISGRTQREIAGDLGVGLSTLVRWISRSYAPSVSSSWPRRTALMVVRG
jgi:transposase-like protein